MDNYHLKQTFFLSEDTLCLIVQSLSPALSLSLSALGLYIVFYLPFSIVFSLESSFILPLLPFLLVLLLFWSG